MPAPGNDNFANAFVVTLHSGTTSGTNTGATDDTPGIDPLSGGSNVWYKWTAPYSGTTTVDLYLADTSPSNIDDTILTIYEGPNYAGLSVVASNDDGADSPIDKPYRSKATFTAVAGNVYYFEVDGYGGTQGDFVLRWFQFSPAYTTSHRTEWKIGVYDKEASPQNSTSYDGSITDEFLKHATDISLTYTLNGIDQLEFTLYLDDPAALLIHKKTTFIRVWRFINDTAHSKTRSPSWSEPDFAGVVTGINKQGEANTMKVTVMGALWRVQTHFHIDNHRLVNDFALGAPYEDGNVTDLEWDHSALMFRLIDLVNGAFKSAGGDTGIRKPPTAAFTGTGYMSGLPLYWPQTIKVSPFYIMKGSYTWPLLYDDLLARAASPDIVPKYIWNPGSIDLMYFNTAIVRGTDISDDVSFDYRTGDKNLDDISESAQVIPGTQGNYVWVFGDGGPNGGLLDDATDFDDIFANGIYMSAESVPGTKLADVTALADDKLAIALKADAEVYTISISPAAPIYYDLDYTLGDLVFLNADRGALQVSDLKQRIYQVKLSMSDNNVESVDAQISVDFKRKFPE